MRIVGTTPLAWSLLLFAAIAGAEDAVPTPAPSPAPPAAPEFRVHPFFAKRLIDRSLNLDKNILEVSVGQTTSIKDSYFDHSGRQRAISLRHSDLAAFLAFRYGVSDNTSFGFRFPYLYRRLDNTAEVPNYDYVDAHGLGDVLLEVEYQVFSLFDPLTSLILGLEVKLPSANTSIGTSEEPSIPLGNGQQEYTFGFAFKQQLFDFYALTLEASHTLRQAALAEYLHVQSEVIPGTPVGNRTIDFGDETSLALRHLFQLSQNLTLGLATELYFRRHTTIDDVPVEDLSTSAASMDLLELHTSSGWYLGGVLGTTYRLGRSTDLRLSNVFPLAGADYPVVQLALVDGLVGLVDLELAVDFHFN